MKFSRSGMVRPLLGHEEAVFQAEWVRSQYVVNWESGVRVYDVDLGKSEN
jgi:hypothetical protein